MKTSMENKFYIYLFGYLFKYILRDQRNFPFWFLKKSLKMTFKLFINSEDNLYKKIVLEFKRNLEF